MEKVTYFMKFNPLRDKSYKFALDIIKLYREIKKQEPVLAKQLLRSGTSIGANAEEAIGAQSEREFISKLMISYRESRETIYWLSLLRDSDVIKVERANILISQAEEFVKIIGKTRSTINQKKL
jgi:four helix bundle protein